MWSRSVLPLVAQAAELKVVGVGSCGLDYLAQVAKFPKPDDKLRTENLQARMLMIRVTHCPKIPWLLSLQIWFTLWQTQGGGNCANALTAAARLGLKPVLITKIGDDAVGDDIINELESDGVDTRYVVRAEGHPSPFTYIIVDREGTLLADFY